ncbi:MAG: hypothetical protein CML24_05830 [Rhizobiales bacterium]|nr:hypothetical protein [Hyphomicrobiales bacterium]|tara:strand:- start:13514 stop:13741 length:228 start_codon:yes stop_codon:yes gene_type:complete
MTYDERMTPLRDLARRLMREGETQRLRDAAMRVWLEKKGDSAEAQAELLLASVGTAHESEVKAVHWSVAMGESDE